MVLIRLFGQFTCEDECVGLSLVLSFHTGKVESFKINGLFTFYQGHFFQRNYFGAGGCSIYHQNTVFLDNTLYFLETLLFIFGLLCY